MIDRQGRNIFTSLDEAELSQERKTLKSEASCLEASHGVSDGDLGQACQQQGRPSSWRVFSW